MLVVTHGRYAVTPLQPPEGTAESDRRHDQPEKLRTRYASVDLDQVEFTGSGPTGRSVTLHLPLRFTPKAPLGPYRVEALATDVHGNSQGFDPVGTLTIQGKKYGR